MDSFEPILYEAEEVGKRVKSSKVKHTWMLDVSDSQFIVEYFDSRISGKVRVTLNEQEIFKGKKQGSEFTIPFRIGLQAAIVVVKDLFVDLMVGNQYFKHVWARIQEELSISEEEFEPDYSLEQIEHRASPPSTDNKGLDIPKAVETKPTDLLIDTLPEPRKDKGEVKAKQVDLMFGNAEETDRKADSTAETSNTSDILKDIFDPQPIKAPTLGQKPGEDLLGGTFAADPAQFPSPRPFQIPQPQFISPNQPFVTAQPVPFMGPYMMPVQMFMTPQGMRYVSMPVPNPSMYIPQMPTYAMPASGAIPAMNRADSTAQYQALSHLPGFTPRAGLIGPSPVVAKSSRFTDEPVILERGNPFTSNPHPQDRSFSSDQQLHSVVDLSNLGKNMHSQPLAQRYQDQIRSVQVPGSNSEVPMKDLQRRS
jgi:hypothetical protein